MALILINIHFSGRFVHCLYEFTEIDLFFSCLMLNTKESSTRVGPVSQPVEHSLTSCLSYSPFTIKTLKSQENMSKYLFD